MSKVILCSRYFQKDHPKSGEPTFFVEKVWKALQTIGYSEPQYFFDELPGLESIIDLDVFKTTWEKYHTVRKGKRWKVGDTASLRVWSGKPYRSKQITFADNVKVEKVFDIDIDECGVISINGLYFLPDEIGGNDPEEELAKNDGLSLDDFYEWLVMPCFRKEKAFSGQIICFTNNINY